MRNLKAHLRVALYVALIFAGALLLMLVVSGYARAMPHGVSYSQEIARDNHPVIAKGFKSFVVTRNDDGTFIVSGEKLGGEAVSISVLVMDSALRGRQLQSSEGIERADTLVPIGTTQCRTERALATTTPCSAVEFTAAQTGRFELVFTPAPWLLNPSYTVSVDDTDGDSMNIHEPRSSTIQR